MADLADTLSLYSDVEGRKVLGLDPGSRASMTSSCNGHPWKASLQYPPRPTAAATDRDHSQIHRVLSIFTAIQGQLGLKLEPTKGEVGIIIIDQVERPSQN